MRTFTAQQLDELAFIADSVIDPDLDHWDGFSLAGQFHGLGELTAEQVKARMNEVMDAEIDAVLQDVGYEYSGTILHNDAINTYAAVFVALVDDPDLAGRIGDPQVLLDVLAGNWSVGPGSVCLPDIPDVLDDRYAETGRLWTALLAEHGIS